MVSNALMTHTASPAKFQRAIVTQKVAQRSVLPPPPKKISEVKPVVPQQNPKPRAPKPVIKQRVKLDSTEPVKTIIEKIIPKKLLISNDPEPILKAASIEKSTTTQDTRGNAASTVIQNAAYRRQSPPSYPRRALDLGLQGTVLIHARVSLIGLPEDLKIAQSSGHRLLDLSALSAVKKWEFEPVSINGKPTIGWVRVPVNFIIQ